MTKAPIFTEEPELPVSGFEDALAAQPHTTSQEGFSIRSFFDFPLFHWKAFFLFLGCCFGVGVNWFFTADIFKYPTEVITAKADHLHALDRYEKNKSYWHAKERDFVARLNKEMTEKNGKEALDVLQKIQPETLLAFLVTSLGVSEERFSEFSIFPKKSANGVRLMLSKLERGIWPLKVMLTLELEIAIRDRYLAITFARLRRGAKDVSRGLAWAYFGAELEPLRNHELFQLPTS